MAFVFLGFAFANLVPPHESTNISEVGAWTLRGTATNMKRFIRLTSSRWNVNGIACKRIPTFVRDWTVEIELHVEGDGRPGGGVYFYFSREVCPVLFSTFTGIMLRVATSETVKNGTAPLYYMNTKENVAERVVGFVNIRGESSTTLYIGRHGPVLTIDASESPGSEVVRIATVRDDDVITHGYFSVSAKTDHTFTDTHDLIAFREFPESGKKRNDTEYDYSEINRGVIENAKRERWFAKERRRQAMSVSRDMFQALYDKDKILDGADFDLRKVFLMIQEMRDRAEHDVAVKDLANVMFSKVQRSVDIADIMISSAASSLSAVSEDMSEALSDLRMKLKDMGISAHQQMDEMMTEVYARANDLGLAVAEVHGSKFALESRASFLQDSSLGVALLSVAATEGVCYLIFFFIKRSRTKGFKKLD